MAALYRTDPPPQPTVLMQPSAPVAAPGGGTQQAKTAGATVTTPGATAVTALPATGTASGDNTKTHADEWLVGVCMVGVVIISIAVVFIFTDDNYTTSGARTVPQGLTIFAIFFVAAQGIERLLEPVSLLFTDADDALKTAEGEVEKAKKAATAEQAENIEKKLASSTAKVTEAKKLDLQVKLDAAATAVAKLKKSKNNRKVIFWALASSVAILASASMELYLLRTVGISSAPRYLEVLATGLIIGAGTKPLHDLVTLISAKAEAAKSGNESKTA
jgi:hypothetical protein